MLVIKCCQACRGDGFFRHEKADLRLLQNKIAAIAVLRDGTRVEAAFAVDRRVNPIDFYEIECSNCDGMGELTWQRGLSLPPLIPRTKTPKRAGTNGSCSG